MIRRATIRTRHDDSGVVAAALRPDNTDQMRTTVKSKTDGESDTEPNGSGDSDGTDVIVTQIDRETTGGLHSTVDDYVVNLDVASSTVQQTTNLMGERSPDHETNIDRNNE